MLFCREKMSMGMDLSLHPHTCLVYILHPCLVPTLSLMLQAKDVSFELLPLSVMFNTGCHDTFMMISHPSETVSQMKGFCK